MGHLDETAYDFNESLLQVTVVYAGDEARLVLAGELDVASAYRLDEELHRAVEHGARTLVLDMSRTSFLDLSGMRALIDGARTARSSGAQMSLAGLGEAPRRLVDALSVQLLLGVV
jgi:anti-sigma B factor antagonist